MKPKRFNDFLQTLIDDDGVDTSPKDRETLKRGIKEMYLMSGQMLRRDEAKAPEGTETLPKNENERPKDLRV
jgi:hypothetical protein